MVITVSGFSGTGKSSLIDKLLREDKNTQLVHSYTTRRQRSRNDCYHFVTPKVFRNMREQGAFIECNCYNDNWYGTPKDEFLGILQWGRTPILDLDWHGVGNLIRSNIVPRDEIRTVFITAAPDVLYTRLTARGTESIEDLFYRLEMADEESMEVNSGLFDYVICNEDFNTAYEKLHKAVHGQQVESDAFDDRAFHDKMLEVMMRLW